MSQLFPFLLVDRIDYINEEKTEIVGTKCVSANEMQFMGHFPNKHVMPGVLMLNSVLTVRNGQAFSHQGKGWEKLTDEAIKKLSERPMPVVFILWGAAARKKAALIDRKKNIIIESPHPSPLSANRGFFGSRPFSKTNAALEALGETPIDWQLPEKVELTEK